MSASSAHKQNLLTNLPTHLFQLDNIMLTKDGQVKLIDFNLSTMFSTDPSRKLTESVG